MVEQFLNIGLFEYLMLSTLIFIIGIAGMFLNRRNIIILLMCIELMLLSVNINFVAFSYYLGNISGQIFSLFIFTVAAAEIAIGLAITVLYFRNKGNISIEETNQMRG